MILVLCLISVVKQQFIELINGTRQRKKHYKTNIFNDMVDIKFFHSNLLKIHKKSYKDIDIQYIGYIAIKKFVDCENIYSVNALYLIIHSATGHFKGKNDEKYLIIDSTEKYEEVWSGIKSEIKTLNGDSGQFSNIYM